MVNTFQTELSPSSFFGRLNDEANKWKKLMGEPDTILFTEKTHAAQSRLEAHQ